jgi:hypothetical protein
MRTQTTTATAEQLDGYMALKYHVGHEIECATYGPVAKPLNVSVECVTCGVILMDFDKPLGPYTSDQKGQHENANNYGDS